MTVSRLLRQEWTACRPEADGKLAKVLVLQLTSVSGRSKLSVSALYAMLAAAAAAGAEARLAGAGLGAVWTIQLLTVAADLAAYCPIEGHKRVHQDY